MLLFIEKYHILNDKQFGFRKKHSTITALVATVDKIYHELDRGNIVAGIFYDISKAFDSLDVNILLAKLSHYGFRGKLLEWFVSYLTNRQQYVYFKSHASKTLTINHGVPQGSVLGPLLFILYINDLPNIFPDKNLLKIFADDTNLFIAGKDLTEIQDKCNKATEAIFVWMSANKLLLNSNKTVFMIFSPPKIKIDNRIIKLYLNSIEIKQVNTTKFLGVSLDCNLTWRMHIDDLCNTLKRYTSLFYKLRDKVPPMILKDIYFAIIHSKINYGIELYANALPNYLERLMLLNNKILRILQKKIFRSHRADLYLDYYTLPINLLFNYNILSLTHKIIYNKQLLPTSFQNYMIPNKNIHGHDTRAKNRLHVSQVCTTFGSRAIDALGANLWNILPLNISSISTYNNFRKAVKDFFLSEQSHA